ncbi:hypothetical protein TVAGG3_0812920 [Trichomonas vaginalis G3]|uniref:hypothetical protein n=1 Tax=Trichomonas vaginalis (strain ATCC PRA-98 / G3) TaxID=412133 RepID=UPI0021E57D9A|nr:hypothetical protein TVAGG3_0812920 [Trichomonas vaginalis G3]KAI5497340.1 hypothetical protein TVAGG3_0812920 [Trichomonas vaginalis G3]
MRRRVRNPITGEYIQSDSTHSVSGPSDRSSSSTTASRTTEHSSTASNTTARSDIVNYVAPPARQAENHSGFELQRSEPFWDMPPPQPKTQYKRAAGRNADGSTFASEENYSVPDYNKLNEHKYKMKQLDSSYNLEVMNRKRQMEQDRYNHEREMAVTRERFEQDKRNWEDKKDLIKGFMDRIQKAADKKAERENKIQPDDPNINTSILSHFGLTTADINNSNGFRPGYLRFRSNLRKGIYLGTFIIYGAAVVQTNKPGLIYVVYRDGRSENICFEKPNFESVANVTNNRNYGYFLVDIFGYPTSTDTDVYVNANGELIDKPHRKGCPCRKCRI